MREMAQLWSSLIEYRPDPTQPKRGRIPLGVLLEAASKEIWNVGLYARAFLSPEEWNQLDGIGREILKSPFDAINSEVKAALGRAEEPGHVLKLLAELNTWSLHVTPPKKERAQVPRQGAKFESFMENKIRELYQVYLGAAEPGRTAPRQRSPSAVPRQSARLTPSPWARPPMIWEMPRGVRRRALALNR
jgi:hypothetical protein